MNLKLIPKDLKKNEQRTATAFQKWGVIYRSKKIFITSMQNLN